MAQNDSPRHVAGSHSVTADNATAETVDIDTGLQIATTFQAQIYRAGVMVMGDATISLDAGVLTIANGAADYSLTAGDVINWVVF